MSLAALERAKLLSRATSSDERRQYVDHLLTLPAYKDPQLTTYFAKSIPTHFAELEDLQDQSVDAVLDLCEDEDERTRICGIKALAAIGKTEPRWVRGNTGVLLQLLESPPTEVRHVRQALYDLMDVSAEDVFGQMAEDCRGSEEETGASRRKILDFLQGSTSKRAEILESGRHVEAEKAFAEGFYEVMQTTAFAEKRQILALLLPLSTISGRTATPASTGRYAKTLTRCLKHGSSVALTTPLIRLWAELVKRNTNIDPRWTIYFLADHGAAVVSLFAEKQDRQAQEVLLAHTADARRLARCMDERSDRDLGAKDLVPDFIETMLKAAQRIASSVDKVTALEMTLYSIYTVVIINRSTRDAVGSAPARLAKEISEFADKQKRATHDEAQIQQWRNIRDMADTLADRGLKPVPITPTWTKKASTSKSEEAVEVITEAAKPSAPTSKSNGQAAPAPTASLTTPTPIKGDLAPGVTPTPAAPSSSSREAVKSESTPTPTAAAGLSIRSAASKIPTPPPTSSAPTSSGAGLSIRSAAASEALAVSPTPPPEPPSVGLSIRSAATKATVPAVSEITPTDGLKILSAQPTPSSAPMSGGLSIRSAAGTAPITAGSSSAPPATAGLSIRSAQPPSLLSRLASSNGGGTAKRPREREEAVKTESAMNPPSRPTSLLDRLASGATPDGESSKRPRPNLLSRMSSSENSTQSAPVTPATPGFAFKRTASTTTPAGGLSIKDRATAGGPELIVRRAISDSVAVVAENDEGVVRKGRGFRQVSDGEHDDVIMTPPPQTATTPATSWGKTGLGGRFQNQKRREWL